MNIPLILQEEHIPEHILQSIVDKAKVRYSKKQDRLDFVGAMIGKNKITNADCFYHCYFERDEQ